jgi:hypothetical protein
MNVYQGMGVGQEKIRRFYRKKCKKSIANSREIVYNKDTARAESIKSRTL